MNDFAFHHSGRIVAALCLIAAVLLAAGCGEDCTPPSKPPQDRNVVSLVPSITEIIFAMGQGDRMIGRSNYCLYPPRVLTLPAYGSYTDVSIEELLSVHPDLVVFNTSKAESYGRLTAAGIRCIAPPTDTVEQVYEAIDILGAELGAADDASALAARLRGQLDTVRLRAADKPRVPTLMVFPNIMGEGNQVRVIGRKTFVSELLDVAGGENVVQADGYPRVHFETITQWPVEVIIISAPGDIAPGLSDEQYREPWARWSSIPAVAKGRIVVLREAFLTIPGPRMAEAAELLLRTVHDDRATEPQGGEP
ncbi:MAG: ABC transporter substrate-binding protein [Planctomycetes bacterium]|nr:ABC transporter substrate-binding protein [Planctomycetota bacterium]